MNISKMFMEEVRDKKRTASGVHSRTGKRGYTGKVRLPSEMLRGKAKKEYMGSGKVKVSNMYETIIPYTDFKGLSFEDRKRILGKYREKHTNKVIQDTWEIDHNAFYRIVKELGLPRTNTKPRQTQVSVPSVPISPAISFQTEIIDIKEKENGLTLSFNGTHSADEIVRKLEKFGLILSDEPKEFKIELTLVEMT